MLKKYSGVIEFTVNNSEKESIFDSKSLKDIHSEIKELYLSDDRPWVIGFSGGKDSTTSLQLVWSAISELSEDQRKKPIYVISSNTLVESPILQNHVTKIHQMINSSAKNNRIPIYAQEIKPELSETFWVNLIGKGYPAPTRLFRWCTDRLKIKPADKYILEKVSEFGEIILVLGVRKQESATRAQVMSLYKIKGSLLSRHTRFPQAFVYTPIENFSLDDVWTYLLQKKSPWGANNKELLAMYKSSGSGECPLVVDQATPTCGGSRFGCWSCTLVTRDKSTENLIEYGETWMKPLLEYRNFLYMTTMAEKKAEFRDYRGRNGYVRFKNDGSGDISRGPYKLSFCKEMLSKLLKIQKEIETDAPDKDFKVITPEEIQEIRRIWLTERGDWDDSAPKIYTKIMGEKMDWIQDDTGSFSNVEYQLLYDVCKKYEIPVDLITRLIDVEKQIQGMTRRSSVYTKIDAILNQEWRTEEEIMNSKKEDRIHV